MPALLPILKAVADETRYNLVEPCSPTISASRPWPSGCRCPNLRYPSI